MSESATSKRLARQLDALRPVAGPRDAGPPASDQTDSGRGSATVDVIAEVIRKSGLLGCGCCATGVPCAACDAEEYVDHDCQTWDRPGHLAGLIAAALASA